MSASKNCSTPLAAMHFWRSRIIDGLAQHGENEHTDGIPAQFKSAVRHRLTGLPATARRLVETVAVAGRPVSLIDLAQLCEMSEGPAYDDVVNDAVASTLVKSSGTEVKFGHDLVRDAVYELQSRPGGVVSYFPSNAT